MASKLSGPARALGAEAIELRNWLLHFWCALEEFRVVVADMAYWLATPPPLWDAYRALMACNLVALNKRPGVRPVGIGEMLRRSIAKLVMRVARDQAKTACGSLQLCADIEAVIEGATHAVAQIRREWSGARRQGRRGVRKGGGKECGGTKKDGKFKGGSESWRDMRSAATTQGVELRGRRG